MSAENSVQASLPGIRAVVFDLDGTLIDSMPMVLKAFAHALAPFRADLDEAAIFQRLGGPPERMFFELTGDMQKAGEAMRRLQSWGFEDGGLVQPFDGMRAHLERLRTRGLRLAIWTGRDRRTTELILTAHDLGGFFSTVLCGDDLTTHKPHPAGMLEILARLEVPAHEALYAGDADADVLGGASAGVRTVLVRHGRKPEANVQRQAWSVVDTPVHAYALIECAVAGTPIVGP